MSMIWSTKNKPFRDCSLWYRGCYAIGWAIEGCPGKGILDNPHIIAICIDAQITKSSRQTCIGLLDHCIWYDTIWHGSIWNIAEWYQLNWKLACPLTSQDSNLKQNEAAMRAILVKVWQSCCIQTAVFLVLFWAGRNRHGWMGRGLLVRLCLDSVCSLLATPPFSVLLEIILLNIF